ncbi:MAG: hypothetical protein JNM99_20660 [Verrucomicrobiaceae bacterium]|nr:hypothetical protein [Verrucomicrobiaceae bacterium]
MIVRAVPQLSGISSCESIVCAAPQAMTDETEDSNNPAKAAYDDAKRHAREGQFAEALERHEWFHHHALEHEPAFYGVRLSFALSAWKELGEKYPPAMASLRRVRDEALARVRASDASEEWFHDVVSINHTLGEDDATIALFSEIEVADADAAKRHFRYLKKVAFERAPDVFLAYTPDLVAYLVEQRRFYRGLAESRMRMAESQPKLADSLCRATNKANEQFDALCEQLIKLAKTAGRFEQASAMEQLVQHWRSPDDAEVDA